MTQYFMIDPKPRGMGPVPWSSSRDKGAFPAGNEEKKLLKFMPMLDRAPGTECHMLTEPWNEWIVVYLYWGPYSQEFYDTLGILSQAGIPAFWKKAILLAAYSSTSRFSMIKLMRSSEKSDSDINIGYMNRSIKLQLRLFVIVQAFNLMSFAAEILSIRSERYNAWRMHRRYFKAIRPLGKL